MYDHISIDLNVLGRILPQDNKNLLIVGSRKMSSYGYSVIKKFIPAIVKNNLTIINGLSFGCETEVIKTALLCKGRAVGILPFGLDYIKKDFNSSNIHSFIKNKDFILISPFDKKQLPTKEAFAYRNFVMLKISSAVLVIEAGEKSKVNYIVNMALEMGKDIYCVPGNIFNYQSRGSNKMIYDGAILLDNVANLSM